MSVGYTDPTAPLPALAANSMTASDLLDPKNPAYDPAYAAEYNASQSYGNSTIDGHSVGAWETDAALQNTTEGKAIAAKNHTLWDTVQTGYNTATDSKLAPYAARVINDLNNNNFADAWSTAESTAAAYGTNTKSATVDPLLQAMESSQGLQTLDPSKQWTSADDTAFYKALGQSAGAKNGNLLGQNPYGQWGSIEAMTSGKDAANNAAQEGTTPDALRFAGQVPTSSFLSKYGAPIVGAIASVAMMAEGMPPLATAVVGQAATDVGNVAAGHEQSIGAGGPAGMILQDTLASIPGFQTGLANSLGGGLGGAMGAGAIVGGASGALTGGLKGAITGAASSAATAGAGYGLGSNGLGLSSGLAGFGSSVVGSLTRNLVGGALSGGSNTVGGNGMMTNGANSVLGGLGTLMGPIGSLMGSSQSGSMANNANTTAGNAGASGNNFGFTGMGGMGGSYSNGQLNLNPGQYGPAANQFSQFMNNQGGMANMFGQGGVPGNVTQGFNQFNRQIGQGIGAANYGVGSGMNMMNMGTNMLNSANGNQAMAYQTALNAGQQALNPQIQQQSNALLNSNFAKGMSGTSGGALQTQALQNSFNTAELQNQNQAVGQGLNAFNSTMSAGQGMFNSGASQMGNFNNQGVSFGQQGMSGAMNYNMFSPQLAGMYQNNANSAASGSSTINNMMLGNYQAGQGAVTNAGNQMNAAARNEIGAAGAYGNNNMWSQLGAGLSAPGAVSGLLGGASSLFGGLTSSLGNLFSGFGSTPNYNTPTYSGDPTGQYGGAANWGVGNNGTDQWDNSTGTPP